MSKPSKLLKVVSIIVIILGSLSVLGGIFTTVMAVTMPDLIAQSRTKRALCRILCIYDRIRLCCPHGRHHWHIAQIKEVCPDHGCYLSCAGIRKCDLFFYRIRLLLSVCGRSDPSNPLRMGLVSI